MDQGTTERLYGNYRAQVVENKDEQKFGRVLVWIPDLMESVPSDQGIWARPANNPIGGRNDQGPPDHHFMGSSYIPKKGAWVWVFFEAGNINRPYYFGALDLENTKVLPENQLGTNFQDKWTIFKSHEGRVIIISDDPDDARVEITGKKRKMISKNEKPTGDTGSVYKIDDNQTTILFDEREKTEKILIRTYKGDFIHIDIDEQKLQIYFKDDIEIKTDKGFYLTAKEDINILSKEGKVNITAELDDVNILSESEKVNISAELDDVNIKAGQDMKTLSGNTTSIKAQQDGHFTAGNTLNHRAGGDLNQDAGGILNDQAGAAQAGPTAGGADPATPATPKGERDT